MNGSDERRDAGEAERLREAAQRAAELDAAALHRAGELHDRVRARSSAIIRRTEALADDVEQRAEVLADYVGRPQRRLDEVRAQAASAVATRKREIASLTRRLWWLRHRRRVFWTVAIAALLAAIWLFWEFILPLLGSFLSGLGQALRQLMTGL